MYSEILLLVQILIPFIINSIIISFYNWSIQNRSDILSFIFIVYGYKLLNTNINRYIRIIITNIN
jgi:hypothetical protein